MEERSDYLTSSDSKSTGKELPPEQELEILNDAIRRCRKAGIGAKVAPFYDKGVQSVVVILAGVQICDGRLVLV